ncbi:MAG: GNAT family N-acetyltransferase [Clostridia bacterium]|nr:GNAT family N-acetyltransferase [Clostridia bacterium]
MNNSIAEQCKRLYISAFHDDEEFTDYLFSLFFESSCKYLLEGETVVSMLFAMDVTCGKLKGKYVYAVATLEQYRGKGYMSRLFDSLTAELKNQYDFLCLKPMSESLFDYYARLGFETAFYKKSFSLNSFSNSLTLVEVKNPNEISNIRKSLINESFVDYSSDFLNLLLSYCTMLTDNPLEPKVFVVKERLSGKVKEVLGDYNLLPDEYKNKTLLTVGNEYRFAMVKKLKNISLNNCYLGFALD